MDNQTAFEFEMKPAPKKNGAMAGMAVRIQIMNGDSMVIKGTSDGEYYEGTLVLRKKLEGASGSDPSALETDGGDECFINGVWYSPCPVGPGGN